MKVIFVTGGAISGLGKGVTSSSIGKILQSSGQKVKMLKIDPYLQIDAGTMSPYEHGEVFVTEDGGECDLDIGNYERFTGVCLGKNNNITTGKVYQSVITKERAGEYLGKTVQIIPHITNEIKDQILSCGKDADILVVEVGGTIGDIESAPFLEAIRQMKNDLGENNVFYCIVAPLLHLSFSGEVKTKLIQQAVSELRKSGIIPNAIICRSEIAMNLEIKEKISQTCDVPTAAIIEAQNVSTIYEVPEYFWKQNFLELLAKKLELGKLNADLTEWNRLVSKITHPEDRVTIGIVGKYTQFQDTYKSITESFIHAGVALNTKVKIKWIDSESLIDGNGVEEAFGGIGGVLIPGGFGERGVEGMILAVQYVRENNIPFLGICLGLQVAVIEFARNMCDLPDAHSKEFLSEGNNLIIDFMEDQKSITQKGGTMRLGSYMAHLEEGTLAYKLYNNKKEISERHRHRYEVNPKYHSILEEKGLVISGKNSEENLVEFIELTDHPFFIATQAHPEFASRLDRPHPLFLGLVDVAMKYKK